MSLALAMLCSLQLLSEGAFHSIRAVQTFNDSTGFLTRPVPALSDLRMEPLDDGSRVVSLKSVDNQRTTTVFLNDKGRVFLIRNRDRSRRTTNGIGTLSLSVLKGKCVELVREVKWLSAADSVHVSSDASGESLDLSVWAVSAGLREYPSATFSFDRGHLASAIFPERARNVHVYRNAPRLPTEELVARALNVYYEYHPMAHTMIDVLPLGIGLPRLSEGYPEPNLSAQLREDIRLERSIPFQMVGFYVPGSDSPSRFVTIDARTGELYGVHRVEPVGGGRRQSYPDVDLRRSTIGTTAGKLSRMANTASSRPKAPSCMVRSGTHVFDAPLDSQGRLWLKVGSQPWRAYRLDAKLLRAARKSAK